MGRRSREPRWRFLTHNACGLKSDGDRFDGYVEWARTRAVFAAALQETWMEGGKVLEKMDDYPGWTLLRHGLKNKVCARGAQGVGSLLSPVATKGWEEAGTQLNSYGDRVASTRIKVKDGRGRPLTLYMVSAYAPLSSAPVAERLRYFSDLQACVGACGKKEVLMIGTDANAALGTRRSEHDRVLGRHGVKHVNNAGQETYQFLARSDLCSPLTFFRSTTRAGKQRYATWFHPNGGGGYQNDHFFMRQRDRKRVRRAMSWSGEMGGGSDHMPVTLDLALMTSVQTHDREPAEERKRIDLWKFHEEGVQESFAQLFAARRETLQNEPNLNAYQRVVDALKSAAESTISTTEEPKAGWFRCRSAELLKVIEKRDERQRQFNLAKTASKSAAHDKDIEQKHKALVRARKLVKETVRAAINTWHEEVLVSCHSLGAKKGSPECLAAAHEDGRPLSPKKAWEMIRILERGRSSTKKHIPMKLTKTDGKASTSPKENVDVLKPYLEKCFDKTGTYDKEAILKVKQRRFRKELDRMPDMDELKAAIRKMKNWRSGAEAQIPAEYFKALLKADCKDKDNSHTLEAVLAIFAEVWKSGSYPGDDNIPEEVVIRSTEEALGVRNKGPLFNSNEEEWRFEFQQVNPKNPTAACYTRYENYKSATNYKEFIAKDGTHADIAWDLERGFLRVFDPRLTPDIAGEIDMAECYSGRDDGGICYPEWLKAKLVLLPKKGDLGLPKNWRGICLLDIASKLLSCVIVKRLKKVMEECGPENQCGFRPFRGTIDGAFNLLMALRKRQEHGLETYVAFIDLVKAFDSVPRECLFAVLRRYGLPDHFINVVIRLHADAVVSYKLGGEEIEVKNRIGVRQGACEGPILFLFVMAAAMETMEWPVKKPVFHTSRANHVLHGERSDRKRDAYPFEFFASLFADDCAVLFDNLEDMKTGMEYMYAHFLKFGLHIHLGRGNTPSKTEAMFFPMARCDDGSTPPNFNVADGFISFTRKFKYLGTHIVPSLDSSDEIDIRIAKASQAFGALSQSTFRNKDVKKHLKGRIYIALILSILLHGCETWFLREQEYQKLRTFHHSCVRAMCRVNLSHTRRHRIRTAKLLDELSLQPLEHYVESRCLRWAGHVVRMDMDRLPRMLLTSWCPTSRVRGRPRMSFAHAIKKYLIKLNDKLDDANEKIWDPTLTGKAAKKEQWRWTSYASKENRGLWRKIIRRTDGWREREAAARRERDLQQPAAQPRHNSQRDSRDARAARRGARRAAAGATPQWQQAAAPNDNQDQRQYGFFDGDGNRI